ncbi:hypothetical protein CVT24_008137 [Panaeolus cyanescens]|uniref:F-box domain-containing protein n=1 Tax=Panaeolus cyanescens TaxID=181874 RepID=A0A409W4J6_9AGAR|nr:hypothetical protein CVT24_008137 [Panaeolus cyanescens]
MSLPQELIDTIIDIVQDDAHTLQQCSLVSTAFLTRAQKHLFREITLSSSHLTRPTRLTHLLAESPHLTDAISSLHIIERKRKRSKRNPTGTNGWLQSDNSHLGPVLSKLPSLKELMLECADCISWTSLASNTRHALEQSVFATGGLVRLILDSIFDVPYHLFENLSSLQELTLKNGSILGPDLIASKVDGAKGPLMVVRRQSKARLRRLHISGYVFEPMQEFIEWMLREDISWVDLSGLEYFTLLFQYDSGAALGDQVDVINSVVQRCSKSLKEMHVIPSLAGLDEHGHTSRIPLHFPSLPRLQTIHLTLEISDYELGALNPNYRWFKACINALQGQKSGVDQLQNIYTKCNVVQGNPVIAFDPGFWKDIEGMLSAPSFRSVRKIKMALNPVFGFDDRLIDVCGMVEQEMKALKEKGILEVAVDLTDHEQMKCF